MLKNYYRGSVLKKLLIYSLIPLLVVSSFVVGVQVFQMKHDMDREILSSKEMFENNIRKVEEDIDEIVNSFELLYSDDNIRQLMFWNSTDSQISIFQKYELRKTLAKTKNIYDFVDNIAVVNCVNDFVIDTNRECDLDVYFDNQRKYEKYDTFFWRQMQSNKNFYSFLPPVAVYNEGDREVVIPLVISCMNGIKTKNYIIVDIKCDYIHKIATQDGMLKEALILVAIDDGIYSLKTGEKFDDVKLLKKIENENVFDFKRNREKYIGFQYRNVISYLGVYRFVELTPKKTLMSYIYTNMYLMLFFIILVVLLNILLCFYFNKRLYSPIVSIKKLLEKVHYKQEKGEDEFALIEKSLQNLVSDNLYLKKNMQNNISSYKERYLINHLAFTDAVNCSKIENAFRESNINFENDYFIVAYIEIAYSKSFFGEFTSEQYKRISDEVQLIFLSEFNDNKETIILSKTSESYVVIFNVKKESDSEVFHRLNKINDIFKFDTEFIRLFIGVGQIHKDFSGMQTSYIEALNAHSLVRTMSNNSGILQYHISREGTAGFYYSLEQENKLKNYILGANITKVMQLLEEIVLYNYELGGNAAVKKVYNQIMHTALRVADSKNVKRNKYININGVNPENAIDVLSLEEFIDYVNKLLYDITSFKETTERVFDIKSFIKYIDEHCAEELYLDKVAEEFGTSSKNLSKLIKTHLGVGFNHYVSMTRVEKIKKLLITTDYHINEIMKMTGFASKTTFLRVFKNFEGVTPSEYRDMLKNIKDNE